jgi:hypothetical protein
MNEFKIGDIVLVKPTCGPMGGQEFDATVVDIVNEVYIVEDGDSDMFEVTAAEMTLSPVTA